MLTVCLLGSVYCQNKDVLPCTRHRSRGSERNPHTFPLPSEA